MPFHAKDKFTFEKTAVYFLSLKIIFTAVYRVTSFVKQKLHQTAMGIIVPKIINALKRAQKPKKIN